MILAVTFEVDFLFDRACFALRFFPVFLAESFELVFFFCWLVPDFLSAVLADIFWPEEFFDLPGLDWVCLLWTLAESFELVFFFCWLVPDFLSAVLAETFWPEEFFDWPGLDWVCLPWTVADVRMKRRQQTTEKKCLKV
ncbi:MAG: hypothetical protein HY881_05030 [Deltaproteobacteria bacterium]|nr:hypothetical protein [Deltaproteobacteria bacterium]